MALQKVKAVGDDDGHWYVIPSEKAEEFRRDLSNEEMVESGEFGAKWSEYMTGGDLNNTQLWADL